MREKKHFTYLIRPVRENFMGTATEEENRVLGEHFAYLQDMLRAGKLVLAGPCLDGAFGVVIFEAEDLDAAQRIAEGDPAVRFGVMEIVDGVVRGFRVSLMSGEHE